MTAAKVDYADGRWHFTHVGSVVRRIKVYRNWSSKSGFAGQVRRQVVTPRGTTKWEYKSCCLGVHKMRRTATECGKRTANWLNKVDGVHDVHEEGVQ